MRQRFTRSRHPCRLPGGEYRDCQSQSAPPCIRQRRAGCGSHRLSGQALDDARVAGAGRLQWTQGEVARGACGTSSGASGEVAHRLPPSLGLPRASITSNGHRLPPSLGSNGASGEVAHRLPDSLGPGNHPIGVRPTRRPRRGRADGNSDKERPKIGIARSAAIAYRATAAGAFDVAPRTHPSRSNAWKAERDRRAHVEAERDRQAHVTSLAGTASNRAATAKSSKEEMKNAGTSAKLQQPRRGLELQQHMRISPSRMNAQSTSPSWMGRKPPKRCCRDRRSCQT